MSIVTPIDRPMSARNRCVMKVSGGVFVLLYFFFNFSVGKWEFVIGLELS